jgi:hypothetical protein
MITDYLLNNGDDISTLFAPTSSGTPSGSIVSYLGKNDTPGWVLCDGTVRTDNQDGKYNMVNN